MVCRYVGCSMNDDELLASNQDPYMWDIARIRRAGELNALREAINNIKRYFSNGDAWKDSESNGTYKKLGLSITKAEHKLKEMRLLLAEVTKIDPRND